MFFFFNDTATTEIYTLSLHDALPIFWHQAPWENHQDLFIWKDDLSVVLGSHSTKFGVLFSHNKKDRSEEHTSELQSRQYLVCRLLLEKKKTRFISLPRGQLDIPATQY